MEIRVLASAPGWRVVAKPSGLPVHRSAMVDERRTLLRAARRAFGPAVSPVHRLDRPTSGCLLLADDGGWAAALQAALAAGQKRYVAFVRGHVTSREPFRFAAPLRAPETKVLQDAVTRFRAIGGAAEPRCSAILAEPETGRWHQIRRHLRDLSHPVLGDSAHGDTRVNQAWREAHGLGRLALHCVALDLPLPDGGRVAATCPLPADLQRVFSAMPWWAEAVAAEPALAGSWAEAGTVAPERPAGDGPDAPDGPEGGPGDGEPG